MTAGADLIADPWSIPVELWPAASILPAADGTWQPAPKQPSDEGIECSLYQLTAYEGSVYDIVAWEIAGDGSIWWLRRGVATFMGEFWIDEANRHNHPCWLVTTPREYLRMAPAACILDWGADVRPILFLPRQGWIIQSPALRQRVERLVSRRTAVQIHGA